MKLPDLSKIPKFVMWIVIAFAVVSIILLVKSYIEYSFFKPYQKYFEVNCKTSDNVSVVVVTAKTNLQNVTIYDINNNVLCSFDQITKDSMEICEYENPKNIGGFVYIKIKYTVSEGTFTAVKDCQVVEKQSLLQKILSKLS